MQRKQRPQLIFILALLLVVSACQSPTKPTPRPTPNTPTPAALDATPTPTTEPTTEAEIDPELNPTPVPPESDGTIIDAPTNVDVTTKTHPFRQAPICSGGFISMELDHVTTASDDDTSPPNHIAINDLDSDGKLDIVLANQRGPSTILWNEGLDPARLLRLKPQPIATSATGGVIIHDGDSDGLLDIIFLDAATGSDFWRNLGERQFEQTATPAQVTLLDTPTANRFGDLDQDGFMDAYLTTNIEANPIMKLPAFEHLGKNQLLRNSDGASFVPVAEWGLGSIENSYDLGMADIDGDGDLDIVVNNLAAPAQLFENQLCGGQSLLVDLKWSSTPATSSNSTQLRLDTTDGQSYLRTFNPSMATQVHFGFANDVQLAGIEIIWPDGARSVVTDLTPSTRLEITR